MAREICYGDLKSRVGLTFLLAGPNSIKIWILRFSMMLNKMKIKNQKKKF